MLVLVVALLGFLVWLITTKIPMDPVVKTAIQIIAVVVILLYVLRHFIALPNVLPSP